MYFKGDIVITDPGYIIHNERKQMPDIVKSQEPKMPQFMRYQKKEDYPDVRDKDVSEMSAMEKEYCEHAQKILAELRGVNDAAFVMFEQKFVHILPKYSKMYEEDMDRFFEAYDKWREPYLSDWERSDCGRAMGVLGFENWMSSDTYYGDWSCTVFMGRKRIGHFCADAGMVCVVPLSEVLKYNPRFEMHKTHKHACALIRDFDGDINFEIKEEDGEKILSVVGVGNINFRTAQTGF